MSRSQRMLKLLALVAALAVLSIVCHILARFGLMLDATTKIDPSVDFNDIQVRLIGSNVQLPTVCQNLTCKEAYVKHLQLLEGEGSIRHPIPRVRHLLWRSENVSAYFAEQLSTWRKFHPDWTVVLWRDDDLTPFVRKHFPAALRRFLELAPHTIMQVDMVRYMLLFKYGGVYADLDYSLSASLDEYRRFYAVVTREPEAHSLLCFGFRWPPRPMANPAFLMAAPGHSFYRYCIEQLQKRPFEKGEPLSFAGPFGLTYILEEYADAFPLANSPLETVYMPPSYRFYPYEDNRMNTTGSRYLPFRMGALKEACSHVKPSWSGQLQRYCTDPNNMDPITDKSQPIVAVHDMKKSGAIYDGVGAQLYFRDPVHVKSVFRSRLQFGSDWL